MKRSLSVPMLGQGTRVRRDRRQGATLVLAIFFIIVIMALAGLVIDVGLARLTHARMQTLADVAAVEGLRFRDNPVPHREPVTLPAERDQQRRLWVNELLAMAHETLPSKSVRLTGGVEVGDSGYQALRTLDAEPNVYVPQLEADPTLNEANPEMASGRYGQNDAYPVDEPLDAIVESGGYERRDFVRSSAEESANANAFLIQLRRTTDNVDPDDALATGGPIPFLFAAGSLVDLGQFAQGIRLRAPAVASVGRVTFGDTVYESGRAKSVGPAQPDHRLAGVAPFGVEVDAWREFVEQESLELTLSPSGSALLLAGNPWGQLSVEDRLEVVGRAFEGTGSTARLDATGDTAAWRTYVPVYVLDPNYFEGRPVTIGFVHLTWQWNGGTLSVRRGEVETIGSGNVSPTLALALPIGEEPDQLTATHVDQLFSLHANNDPTHAFPHSLLSPVLANRHIGRQP